MAAVLIQCGRHRGVRSTGVLFIYWLLQLVSAVLVLQTHARAVAAGVVIRTICCINCRLICFSVKIFLRVATQMCVSFTCAVLFLRVILCNSHCRQLLRSLTCDSCTSFLVWSSRVTLNPTLLLLLPGAWLLSKKVGVPIQRRLGPEVRGEWRATIPVLIRTLGLRYLRELTEWKTKTVL